MDVVADDVGGSGGGSGGSSDVGGRRPVINDGQKEASAEMGLKDEITWPRVHGGVETIGWVLVSYFLLESFELACVTGEEELSGDWDRDEAFDGWCVVTRTGRPKDDRML